MLPLPLLLLFLWFSNSLWKMRATVLPRTLGVTR